MQQAALYRRERQTGEVNVVLLFVFCLRKSARSAGDFVVHLCGLIEYAYVNILPQITQITQRGMQQAALSRRERQIGLVVSFMWFCCFWVSSA